MGIMGPIGTVKRSFLPFGFSRGNVDMHLSDIKRVDGDKEKLTALVTVKRGKHQKTEHARLTWNAKHEGFVVKSSGVDTVIDDSGSIEVEFSMEELDLDKKMKLKMDKSINEDNPLKEEEEEEEVEEEVEEEEEEEEVDIKDLKEQLEELMEKVEGLEDDVEKLQDEDEELEKEDEEVLEADKEAEEADKEAEEDVAVLDQPSVVAGDRRAA